MSYREKKAKVRPLSLWLAEAEGLLRAKATVPTEKEVVVERVAEKTKPKKKARLPEEKVSL